MNPPPRGPGRPGAPRPVPPGRPGRPGGPPLGSPRMQQRPTPVKTNPLPIIYGTVGVLLVVLVIVILMPGKQAAPEKTAAPPPPPPAAPKPVDVSGLERDGEKMCSEGWGIIQNLRARMDESNKLSLEERRKLKVEVKKGLDLLKKGLEYFGEANEKSGKGYDLKNYMETKKYAANVYQGLPD